MKLKRYYTHNGLSIYQTKNHVTCLTTPLQEFPAYNIQSSSSGQNNIVTSEIATSLLQNCN